MSDIDFEKLIKQLLIPHRDSLLTRVFLIYRDYDKTYEILDILCSLNKKLNEECKCDIRNAILFKPLITSQSETPLRPLNDGT